jgi:hypothetical protein
MCRGKAEVWDEQEESRCREAAVLAEDDWGCSAERDVAGRVRPVITDSSTSGFHPSKLAREVMPK